MHCFGRTQFSTTLFSRGFKALFFFVQFSEKIYYLVFFFPLLDTEIKKMEQIIKSPLISLTWKHPTLGSPPDKVILLGFFIYIRSQINQGRHLFHGRRRQRIIAAALCGRVYTDAQITVIKV